MRIVLLSVVSSAVISAGTREDLTKKDLKRLQGAYLIASMEVEGKLVSDARLKGTTLTIKGDRYILKVKDQTFETVLRLDPTKDPKEVDMVFVDGANKDKVGKGIYKLDGDTFKLCRALLPDRERPTEFATWPNSGVFLITWKRTKP